MFPDYIKSKWAGFAQAAIWIMAIAGTFLIAPPLLNRNDTSPVTPLTRFIIAGLIAIIFIVIKKRSAHKDYRLWYRVAIASFIICLVFIGLYAVTRNNWSVKFYNNKVLATGKTMFAEAVEQKKEVAKKLGLPFVDDELFVSAREGDTQLIWPIAEIRTHFYIMFCLYVLCVIGVACFIISIIQSIFCYEKDNSSA
ncbi:hypothetical protein F0L74_21665 [Chitinophaga agrisoli]|uniref:Uncharacterized protein n=1 Tax=Chitinophaga agrisoli TaxID=2607653 RepID=A0A5B2VIS1_9BACT|nr:hypothetical protein [Chitinophaga agrisoli]KAA2238825.1 hypothetical protein F0L74_21665 [Chitinophaga agrisoli]